MSRASEKFFHEINGAHRAFSPETLDILAKEKGHKGEHLWIALVTYHITDESVKNLSDSKQVTFLDSENLMSLNFGCFLCETPFSPGLVNTICLAGQDGKLEYKG